MPNSRSLEICPAGNPGSGDLKIPESAEIKGGGARKGQYSDGDGDEGNRISSPIARSTAPCVNSGFRTEMW